MHCEILSHPVMFRSFISSFVVWSPRFSFSLFSFPRFGGCLRARLTSPSSELPVDCRHGYHSIDVADMDVESAGGDDDSMT